MYNQDVDKLAAMATFVEIVERGSLTAAAASLDRSLPTVVRTLANLEEALGVRLLRRTTRRMSLTEEGSAYLERARKTVNPDGKIPELYFSHTERSNENIPLGWAESMYVVALVKVRDMLAN